MNIILEELKKEGCDIDSAVRRCLGEELCLSCLKMVVNDENFEKLGEAIKNQNVKSAFEIAHSLKGITGNVGLTPLYRLIAEIVEPLRAGKCDGLDELYNKIIATKNLYYEIVN